jgi:hypothetical protein
MRAGYQMRESGDAGGMLRRLDYNRLFRWFTGLGIGDPVGDVTVFTKGRDRLLHSHIARDFFRAILSQPQIKALLSDEHFSVDSTLIGRRCGATHRGHPRSRPTGQHEELQAEGRRRAIDERRLRQCGARLSRREAHQETHGSTTGANARLVRTGCGKEAKLCLLRTGTVGSSIRC